MAAAQSNGYVVENIGGRNVRVVPVAFYLFLYLLQTRIRVECIRIGVRCGRIFVVSNLKEQVKNSVVRFRVEI